MEVLAIKIVTINIPESYVDAMEKLVGENGLYPSRSELVRVAVREFLLKELKIAEKMSNFANDDNIDNQDDFEIKNEKDNYVKVPVINDDKLMYKTYKIVRRLE